MVKLVLFGFLIGWSASYPAYAITPETISCVAYQLQVERIRMIDGDESAELYARINFQAWFHPSRDVRAKAYRIFSSARYNPDVLADLEIMPHSDIELLIRELDVMGSHRNSILKDYNSWKKWKETILPNVAETADFVEVGGKKIYADYFKDTQRLQKLLHDIGVETEFVPARTFSGERQGRGVLVINRVTREPARKGLFPGKPVLDSADFRKYLDAIHEQQGAIIIDPDLLGDSLVAAYFWEHGELAGKKFVLGIKPDTNGSTFLHEWEHKIDAIDNGNQFEGLVGDGINPRKSLIGKSFYEAGRYLEGQFLTELNATGRQYKFYFETKRFPPLDVLNTVIYRGVNQMKVAVGRIYMDPRNSKHFILYLRGFGNIVIPISVLAGVGVGSSQVVMDLAKFVVEYLSHNQIIEQKNR